MAAKIGIARNLESYTDIDTNWTAEGALMRWSKEENLDDCVSYGHYSIKHKILHSYICILYFFTQNAFYLPGEWTICCKKMKSESAVCYNV